MKRMIYTITIILCYSFFCVNFVNATVTIGTDNDCPVGETCLENPLETDSPQIFIGQIINGVLGIVGSLALAMFIYGGFLWMTAAGNAEQVTKGRNVLVWATLGIIIIFSSYALVRFVIYDVIQPNPPAEQTN